MAVIKYSALLDELRGKLNGTVFSKFHDGYNSYKKGQPSKWGSEDQQRRRQQLSVFAKNWSTASQDYRNAMASLATSNPQRDRFGDLKELPAFQYSILVQTMQTFIGQPATRQPIQAPSTLSDLDIVNSNITIEQDINGAYIIAGTMEILKNLPTQHTQQFILSISRAVPATNRNVMRTHMFFATGSFPSSGSSGFTINFSISPTKLPRYFSPVTGDQLELKIRSFRSNQSIVNPPTYHRIPFTYVPPAPPEWPITWSFSGSDGRFTELQNAGGTWQPQGTGTWLASPNENLAGVAADYEFELAMSPNLFSSDIARPEEFDDPRPTLSGTLAAKSSFAPYYITPAAIGDLQAWMRSNFSYTSGDGYKYQPTAIRIKNPTSGAWSNWGYSNIWLPIF